MKIVCDKYIPFLADAVKKEWPNVLICPMEPEQIRTENIRDADVLVVRTRTQVNEELLEGSNVRLVCTATIGFDHIDISWCETHHIRWISCPGCNASAVRDYIEEVIDELFGFSVSLTVGVVGVGHVGSLVAQMAERRGLSVLLNDPPKNIGVSLDTIARQCDVITFHTPLSKTGTSYPTYHLCDAHFLAATKPHTLIINAARGGVVDEQALIKSGRPFVLDTWENEPHIHPEVTKSAILATMHIAGYSWEGKRNATQMCLDAISDSFRLPPILLPLSINDGPIGDSDPGWIKRTSNTLKAHPEQFEALRRHYALR